MEKQPIKPGHKNTAGNAQEINKPVASTLTQKLPTVKKLSFILIAISLLLYANTLNNGYVIDDLSAIKENNFVLKGVSAIPEILSTPYHQGYKKNQDTVRVNDLYRPLSLVMFAAEHQVFGDNPTWGHLVNVLLFAGCVVLLFLFLDRLFERKKTGIAFISALLFAVHPIHTEVVANIKSRDELLCYFFAFCSLVALIKYTWSGKAYWLITGASCYFLSLLSKETSICFLAVIPLVFFFYLNEARKRSIYITMAALTVAIVYLYIRFTVLKVHHADDTRQLDFIENALAGAPSYASRIATAILILGYYLKLMFIPYPLICDYAYASIPFVSFSNIWTLLSLAIYVVLIVIGISRLFRKKKDPYAFGILFFLLTIALFSNILFLIGDNMAERFVFFASTGFCIVMALLLWQWLANDATTTTSKIFPSKIWYIVIPVSVVFGLLTINRNAEWKDNYTLFKADIQKAPDDARLWYYLGYETKQTILPAETNPVAKRKVMLDAIACFQKALSIYPDYFEANRDLGNLFCQGLLFDSGEVHAKRALAHKPKEPSAMSDLGYVYFCEKQYPKTVALCKQALRISPNNAGIMNNLAICYLQMEAYDSALTEANKALQSEPGNQLSIDNIAAAKKGLAKMDSLRK